MRPLRKDCAWSRKAPIFSMSAANPPDRDVPRSGGFAADIEKIGAFLDHAQSLRNGRITIVAKPVTAERIRRDVHDPHHIGPAAPFEPVAPDLGDHDAQYEAPRNLRFRGDPLSCEQEMRLEELARGVPDAALEGSGDVEVRGIAYDSRRVKPGDLFVAVTGIRSDGHAYAADAVAAGAVAVAVQRSVAVPAGTPIIRLPSTRTGLADIAAEFYGRPSRLLYVAGITGTDGKTTVTHMAEHVLMASGVVAGAMSTVAFSVSGEQTDNTTGQTTTEAPQVQDWLRRMVDAGVKCAVIETTSHALVQERVRACDFDVAAFTNVGHDHMDYHATWEDYLEAKGRLIDLAATGADKGIEKTAIFNPDDPSYERLSRRSISRRWSYGLTTAADLHPLDLSMSATGSRFRPKTPAGANEGSLARAGPVHRVKDL